MKRPVVGYRYVINNPTSDKVLKYTFKPGSSIGRVASQMVKHMLFIEKSDPKLAYIIESPGTLTFSSSKQFLVEKYTKKYDCGHRHAGPFYEKSECGLFKIILRTMMKHKGKHKRLFKKICIFESANSKINVELKEIITKDNSLIRNTSLKELIGML